MSGIVAFLVLILYAIANPSSFVSILFIMGLIGVAGSSLYIFAKNMVEESKTTSQKETRIKRAEAIYTNHQVNFLNPTQFEHYVASILEKLGYTVIVTPPTNDGGIDLILKRYGVTIGVQIKKWRGNVSRPDLQKLVGAGWKFDRLMCVTTSDFSIGAREYANEHAIRLVGGDQLTKLAEAAFGKDHVYTALSNKIMGKFGT